MKRIFVALCACFMCVLSLFSQQFYIEGDITTCAGFDKYSIDYTTLTKTHYDLSFSPASGIGLQGEGGYVINKFLSFGLNISYNQMLVFQFESGSEGSNKSSVSFAKLYVAPKIDFNIYQNAEKMFRLVQVGLGGTYVLTGSLKITENNTEHENMDYDNPLGCTIYSHTEFGVFRNKDLVLTAGANFHILSYTLESNALEENYKQINGNNLMFKVGIRKYL